MRVVIQEEFRVGTVLDKNKLECLYEGDIADYQEWLEELKEELEGETSMSYERKIPHGDGSNYTIYGQDENIYIFVKEITDGDGTVILNFGRYI